MANQKKAKSKKATKKATQSKRSAASKVKRVKKKSPKKKVKKAVQEVEPFDPETEPKGGRPTLLTKEIADFICLSLAEGTSLRSICLFPGVPAKSTVLAWLTVEKNVWFLDQYTRARGIQADTLFDETLDIADDGSNDYVERKRKDGSTYLQFDHEHVQRSKLRIETRHTFAAQVAPKKYHPRQILSDPDGNSPTDPLAKLLGEIVNQPKGFNTNGRVKSGRNKTA